MTSSHGYLGARVVSSTERQDGRQLVVIDASHWNLVSWSDISLIWPQSGKGAVPTDIVGPTCYEDDIWFTGVCTRKLAIGDIIIVKGLGSYVASMHKTLHSLPTPAQILL